MDFSQLYEAEGEGEDEADLFAQSLTDEFRRQNEEGYEPPPKCHVCRELDQTTACLDCRRGYCQACLDEHHLVKRFSAHQACTLEELEAAVEADAKFREECVTTVNRICGCGCRCKCYCECVVVAALVVVLDNEQVFTVVA